MANYELIKMGEKRTLLHPVSTSYSDEYAEKTQKLFLRSKIVDNGYGKLLTRVYRLYAMEPHSIEMALAYDIECPECGKNLRQIGRCVNSHKLGLYRCPACDRAKGVE